MENESEYTEDYSDYSDVENYYDEDYSEEENFYDSLHQTTNSQNTNNRSSKSSSSNSKPSFEILSVETDSNNFCLTKVYDSAKKLIEDYGLVDLSVGTVIVLLNKFNWDVERLIERYYEDSDRVLKQVGLNSVVDCVIVDDDNKNGQNLAGEECQVCFDNKADTGSPLCQHNFCLECYTRHWFGF